MSNTDTEQMRQTLENINKTLGEQGGMSRDARAFSSVRHGQVTVDITPGEGGDLKTQTPNIEISVHFADERGNLKFTWDEARRLSDLLTEITDLAEFG